MECEVKRALESITTNKASGDDGIPVELFQILKDNAVNVLHSICQQIWKTWQWQQDWKSSVFIPISKKGNAKECSNYHTIAFISYANKVMLKIPSPLLALFIVMLPKAHVTSHSRMSGSRWCAIVIIWVVKIFFVQFSMYSCHLFLISSASVRSYHFCSLLSPSLHEIFPWYL